MNYRHCILGSKQVTDKCLYLLDVRTLTFIVRLATPHGYECSFYRLAVTII